MAWVTASLSSTPQSDGSRPGAARHVLALVDDAAAPRRRRRAPPPNAISRCASWHAPSRSTTSTRSCCRTPRRSAGRLPPLPCSAGPNSCSRSTRPGRRTKHHRVADVDRAAGPCRQDEDDNARRASGPGLRPVAALAASMRPPALRPHAALPARWPAATNPARAALIPQGLGRCPPIALRAGPGVLRVARWREVAREAGESGGLRTSNTCGTAEPATGRILGSRLGAVEADRGDGSRRGLSECGTPRRGQCRLRGGLRADDRVFWSRSHGKGLARCSTTGDWRATCWTSPPGGTTVSPRGGHRQCRCLAGASVSPMLLTNLARPVLELGGAAVDEAIDLTSRADAEAWWLGEGGVRVHTQATLLLATVLP